MGARGSIRGLFDPSQEAKIGAWLRLGASTPVSGEWETVSEVLGGTNATQTDADRKPASTASANGLPTATFDGTDMWRLPLASNTYNTSKLGLSHWVSLASAGSQYMWAIMNNDSSGRSVILRSLSGALICDIYIGSNIAGRSYTTTTGLLPAGTLVYPRLQLDMTRTDEFDTDGSTEDAKVRMFVGETPYALTASDIGAGGALTTLRSVTGVWIMGALNDSDAPSAPVANGTVWGPNSYVWRDTPTTAEALAIMNFEVPT